MRLPRFPHFSILISALSLSFAACQKEGAFGTDDSSETVETNSTTDCSEITATIAHASEEPDNTQLLLFFNEAQIADLHANTCLAKDFSTSAEEVADRASGLKNQYWTPGQTIRVRFLNGSTALQNKVFACAKEWENYANIHFTKVTSGTSEVRVLFANDGHWSYIGTGNSSVDDCEETMSLELKDLTAAAEIRRVALHEFGHVLGMMHEHQQPLANIPWNTTAVYAYYAEQDWTKDDVNEQVLNKNAALTTQYTAFDATSIMEYPVSASLTTNNFSIGWNSQLSAADKSFIGMMYSSNRIKIRHAATGYNANITFLMDGIYHTIKPGESLQVPAYTAGNQLSIYEQPSGSWVWDSGYTPVYGKNYKVVRVGSTNNLMLAAE